MSGNKISLIRTRSTRFSSVSFRLKDYLQLLKFHLCLYIGLSAIFGHVTAGRTFTFDSLFLGGFVWILACGSAVLNNIQDRMYDLYFSRTCDRTLPQERVPVIHALGIAIVTIGIGLMGILLLFGFASFLLGVAAVICYNGMYTPMKKVSLLAIIPGTLCGILPPFIGWSAVNLNFWDMTVLRIIFVFASWQITHFFILLLKNNDGTSSMISSKPFPSFLEFFTPKEMTLQVMIWASIYSLSMLSFLMSGSIQNPLILAVSAINAVLILFVISTTELFLVGKNRIWTFAAINLSMLLFMGAGIYEICLLG